MRVHLIFVLKEKEHPLKPSDIRFTSLYGHISIWASSDKRTVLCCLWGCDVIDPMYFIPVTPGTGVGEMGHPSVMTISLSTYRVRNLALYFSLDSFMLWSVTEYLSIPTELRHLFLL